MSKSSDSGVAACGRGSDTKRSGVFPAKWWHPTPGNPRRLGVSCSQWASCGWRGRRKVEKLGVQPDPCPRCGKEVVA